MGFFDRAAVQVTVTAAVIVLFVTLTYWGFRSPYYEYLIMLHAARHPGAFPMDPSLTDSIFLNASIYYPLVRTLRLPVEHDLFGIVAHIILNGGVLYLLFRQARRAFALTDAPQAALFVLVACFFYSKFVLGAMAQPTAFHTLTPTGLAHVVGFASLLLLLEGRVVLATLLVTLTLALAPKGNILLGPAFVLYLLMDRTLPRRAYAYALLPVAFVAYRAFTSEITGMTHEDAIQMTSMVMANEDADGLFAHQPLLANVLLPASFIIFPFLIRAFTHQALKVLSWSLFVVTVAAVAINAIYPLVYEKFPVPVVVLLSIPQATKYFLFVFSAMAVAWILREPRLLAHEKFAALVAFVVLKPFPGQALAALGLVLAGIAAPRLYAKLAGGTLALEAVSRRVFLVSLPVALAMVLFGFVLFRSGTTYAGPSWIDRIAFRHSGTWSASVWADDDAWLAWEALAKKPGDFPLFAVYKRLPTNYAEATKWKYHEHVFANTTSGKSRFSPLPLHATFKPKLWRELQWRRVVRNKLFDDFEHGTPIDDSPVGTVMLLKEKGPITVNESIPAFLSKRGVRILVPRELSALFPAAAKRENIGTYVLISFNR